MRFCSQCGAECPADAQFCTQCGVAIGSTATTYQYESAKIQVNTYLVHNILVALFCCLPLGVIGLIFSILAYSACGKGDIDGAQSNASIAKIFFWISVIFGVLAGVIFCVLNASVAMI